MKPGRNRARAAPFPEPYLGGMGGEALSEKSASHSKETLSVSSVKLIQRMMQVRGIAHAATYTK